MGEAAEVATPPVQHEVEKRAWLPSRVVAEMAVQAGAESEPGSAGAWGLTVAGFFLDVAFGVWAWVLVV